MSPTGTPCVLAASDLDRTLIYSAGAACAPIEDLVCVEVLDGAPISYVARAAVPLLESLGATGALVPVTTRTLEQYGRVRLPGRPSRWAVCANGGHLVVDGLADAGWAASVGDALAGSGVPLPEVEARLAHGSETFTLKRREADGLFAYLVVDRAAMPPAWVDELRAWCDQRGWTVSVQGRKVYAVPVGLSKAAAVAEVVARSGASSFVAAGDSLLDADLLQAATAGVHPGHGELAASGWSAPGVTALASSGALAGTDVALWLLTRVTTRARPTPEGADVRP